MVHTLKGPFSDSISETSNFLTSRPAQLPSLCRKKGPAGSPARQISKKNGNPTSRRNAKLPWRDDREI
jgi:hypothetical protein